MKLNNENVRLSEMVMAPRVAINNREELLGEDVISNLYDALQVGALGNPYDGTTYTINGFPVAFVYDSIHVVGLKNVLRDLEMSEEITEDSRWNFDLGNYVKHELDLWELPISDREIRIALQLGDYLFPALDF